MNAIPLVDLTANYLSLKKEIDLSIQSVINQTAFIGGSENKFVTKFEEDFSSYLGVASNKVVSCANGTDAIEIALQTLGIGQGDEALVPALTWISTAEAVINIGAIPVFVDIDPTTFNIDTKLIEQKITPKTKAIIAVHLYGCPADVDAINTICKKHMLFFIEDCAQAHGAEVNGKKVGTFGDAATFSFYPGKNLGAFGDAGAIIIKDSQKTEIAKQIANHGQKTKHTHIRIGRNSRLDGIQAAILSAKLPHLERWNELRISHANYYNQLLNNNYSKPQYLPSVKHVFHLYVIKVNPQKRNDIINHLTKNGVSTAIHYPSPLSEMPIFKKKTTCPNARSVCKSILSLPLFPELSKGSIDKIATLLNTYS